jgi:WD40 repeat protein
MEGARFNDDESIVLTWSSDGNLRFWSVEDEIPILGSIREVGSVTGAAFHSDGSYLVAAAHGMIQVWDTQTRLPMLPRNSYWRHEGLVNGVMPFQRSDRILTWSADGRARIWRLPDIPHAATVAPELACQATTGSRLNDLGEVEILPRKDWQKIKQDYDRLLLGSGQSRSTGR